MKEYKETIRRHHDKYASEIAVGGSLYSFKLNLVKEHLTRRSNLLDLGCGNGQFAIPLTKDAGRIVAVDFSPRMIEELGKRVKEARIKNIRYHCADFLEIKLKPRSFDTAISFSTLYYVKELDQLFTQVSRWLKPNGIFIFDVLNKFSLGAFYYSDRYKIYQNFLDIPSFRTELDKYGFVIEKEYCFELIPRFRTIQKLLDLKVGKNTFDFFLSNAPAFKSFAFRHIFVCRKVS